MYKIGIDLAKDKFDVYLNGTFKTFSNNTKGFAALLKWCGSEEGKPHFLMEASGPYYLRLATFLHERGEQVSVLNPLVIRRFAQMQLRRTKTDQVDAQVISQYGEMVQPAYWEPASQAVQHLQQLLTAREQLISQQKSTRNCIGSLQESPDPCKEAIKALQKVLSLQQKEIDRLDKQIKQLAKETFPEQYQLLVEIPAIGPQMATMLLVMTNGFSRFENAKQLVAFAGLSPRTYQSGKTIIKNASISKMGSAKLRQLAYLCALSAVRVNESCKALYIRLLERGKAKKVALIAAGAKLIRQAFAVGKHKVPFQQQYNGNKILSIS